MIGLLFKMLYILVLCRVLLTASVQTLTIDSQLGTSIEDCFERNSIGDQLPSDAIFRNVSELTNRECEQICKQDKQCQSYDYGVGAKGNATCNLSTLDEKTIKEQSPLKRHPDYDVYIRRFQCEQSPPSPIQPLSDDPGAGPQHRPVFRPEVDERPSAEDYLISGDIGYGKPTSSYRPDDPANSKPDYDAPPSYGDHKPQDIPYKPNRPNDKYGPERPGRPNDPYRPNSPYEPEIPSDPYGPARPNDPPYGPDRPQRPQRPNRPESNDELQFQDINKPRPGSDGYPPDPYRPEKPEYHYIIRPNRKPRPQDYPRPDPYYDGHPSGPIGPPTRPDKPTYSYNGQYASNYGQNTQNDNSIHTEIYDPPRPYIPIKDRPNQQYNGQGYLGYGTYSSQNSYSQSQNSQYHGTITEIGGYGQNDRPYKPQRPYKPPYDRPQKPGYGTLNDRPQKPAYGSIDEPQRPAYGSLDERPQKPEYGASDDKPQKPGYGSNGYGSSGYQKPNEYEKPSYNQDTYGSQGYGSSQGSYGSNQVSYNNNKGSYTDKGSYSSQSDYNQGGYVNNKPTNDNYGGTGYGQNQKPNDYNKPSYGSNQGSYGSSDTNQGSYNSQRPTNDNSNYGETGYGLTQKPNDYNKPSYGSNQGSYGSADTNQGYGSHNSYKGSYSSSYNEQNSHYGSQTSYETNRPYDQQTGYGSGYQKPQKPDKPYNQDPYGSNQGYGNQGTHMSSYGSSQSSYENNNGYGSSHGNQGSSQGYGSQSGYGSTQSSYGSGQGAYGSTQGNQDAYSGHKGSYGISQGSYGSTSSHSSSQTYGESQYADQSTYGGYGNRPNQRPGYGNDRPDYSNRPDYDYDRPGYGQKPGYGDQKPGYDEPAGYGQKPSYDSQTTGYGQKPAYDPTPSYNGPKPGYNDPKPGYNDPKPGYNDPKPGYNDPKPSYNDPNPGYNDPKPGYNDPNPGYNDPKPGYNDPNSGYGAPKPGYNDPKPGYNDPKPSYDSESDYRPDVKPVYEYEIDRPNNVPAYIAKPGGEVVTSRPVVIGDYERPVYKDPGVPGKEVSYKACFKRVLAGQRALRSFVRKVVPCETLEDCRRECATERRFHCESFNYRLDPSFRGKGLCELMTKPIEAFDIQRDFVQDKDYDFYEVDRNSLEPNCPETLRGPGLLHSGFLSSKDRPRDDRDRPNRLDGWRDRNDFGGFSYDDGRYKGNRRHEDRFVPYQIGLARTNDKENWGQYGGVYGGSQYYKNRNDYHKSIHHWGLTSERPTYGVKHYNDHNFDFKDTFDYHGKDHRHFDYHEKNHKNHDRTNDHHVDRIDYHNDRNDHSLTKDDFDYHSLGKDGREYHSSGEDFYGVGKTQYGNGSWKRGRWNSSGVSNGLDFGNDLSKNFEPVDRSDESNARDCFSRRRPGMSLSTGAIRRSLIVRNVVACETACFGEKEFKCVSYSYRYSNSRGIDNCFLSERPFHGLDLSADSGSDVYGMPQDQGCSTVNQTPWIESECFYHVRSDTVVSGTAVKSTLTVAGLGACEAECIRARGFYCRGFSFRFDSPTIGEELHNCILTSLATPSLNVDTSRRAGGHELYARGNYGKGCEPHPQDVSDNGECYLQYDKAAKLTPSATRGHARVKTERACSAACTEAPFRCLSFSYNNNAPPDSDNCLLSEIRLFDLQRDVDYVHSGDDWLFAFDIFNSKCWRRVHSDDSSSEIPHPIHTSSEEDSYPSGPSGPGYLPDSGNYGPSGPPSGYHSGSPSGPPSGPPETPSGPPSGPGYSPEPEYKLPGPYKPSPYPSAPSYRPDPYPDYKPDIRPEPDYKPSFRPDYKPVIRPDYQPVARPDYQPTVRPDYQPPVRPEIPFRPPDRDYKPFRPESRPEYRPELPGPYKPGFRPDYPKPVEGFKPGFRPGSGYLPEDRRPVQRPQRPVNQGDRGDGPLEVSWRHYTVSGFPCRAGTTCAQNHIVGHWACEPEGGEIGSWDYCCAPTHRCGYSEGFHKPWCYVGHQEDQWRPCSEKYYPYHQHNIPHPSSQGHREEVRPNRPHQNSPPQGNIPHWDKPAGQYLSASDKLYWDQLYDNGPSAYYDKYGNPLPGYSRVPTENRPRIRNRYNNRPGPGSGSGNWIPVGHDDPTGVPGALGAPRYWPVAYLHKSPPPNTTYFRYNETRPTTTTERTEYTTKSLSRELPSESRILPSEPRIDQPNDLDAKSSRDDKKINISKSDDVYNTDLENDTTVNITTEIPNIPTEKEVNISEVDTMKTENYKEIDRIDGIDDKLDDFSKSIEVLDIEDAKGDKFSDLKTLEAEERQIEAIGRLLAARRGTRLVIEKRSQKDLENKNIAVDKDLVDFNFGNRFPTERRAERRGVIKRISKDELERDRNDRSLEVSETTYVRPPRVLSTTENIRKAIVNGKVFYDATIREQRDVFTNKTRPNIRREDLPSNNFREQRDLYLNSTRKPKHLKLGDDTNETNDQNSPRRANLKPIDDVLSVSIIKNLREERDTIHNRTQKLKRRQDDSFSGILQRDSYINSTRKAKSLRKLDDSSTPSIISSSNFGKRKTLKQRNVNPVRRVRRVYRKRYNPEEVRKRLLEREKNKNSTEASKKA